MKAVAEMRWRFQEEGDPMDTVSRLAGEGAGGGGGKRVCVGGGGGGRAGRMGHARRSLRLPLDMQLQS